MNKGSILFLKAKTLPPQMREIVPPLPTFLLGQFQRNAGLVILFLTVHGWIRLGYVVAIKGW
eukprot:scaffold22634_cov123-Cylindrotheca_fusiformis.AAC.17